MNKCYAKLSKSDPKQEKKFQLKINFSVESMKCSGDVGR